MNIPLNIDWQQILLHVLNFVLYKPVKNFMAKREAHYAEMAQKAQSELDSAEKIKADYQEQLKSVEGEISAKRTEAQKELDRSVQQQLSDAHAQADKIVADAQKDVFLGRKVMVNGALGQPRALHDVLHGGLFKAFLQKQARGFCQYALHSRLGMAVAGHVPHLLQTNGL